MSNATNNENENELSYYEQEEVAEALAEDLDGDGYRATVSGSTVRLSRKLSRGWQSIGYLDVMADGTINCTPLSRERASLTERVQAVAAPLVAELFAAQQDEA